MWLNMTILLFILFKSGTSEDTSKVSIFVIVYIPSLNSHPNNMCQVCICLSVCQSVSVNIFSGKPANQTFTSIPRLEPKSVLTW